MNRCLCDACGREVADPLAWRCPCGGTLSIAGPDVFDPGRIDSRAPGIWRYRFALGVPGTVEAVTLGEGATPIVERSVDGLRCRFKLEYLSPTGSFKDRGATVVVSHLANRSVTHAIEDSSGNAGHAMAAYAAHAGIRMEILTPEGAPRAKRASIETCGATVTEVAGDRAAVSARAMAIADGGTPFASHVWNPWFACGTRSFAFEIWEQQPAAIPERIFLPVGNASLLTGAYEGFRMLRAGGVIPAIPRMMAVQADACAPLVPGAARPGGATRADGIRVVSPPRAAGARAAVEGSAGAFLAVRESAIERARTALAGAGLDVEPTSAVAFAGALAWSRRTDETCVPLVALTGSGLKVPQCV